MKDMPFFTTSYGVASLTLKEIPYSKKAYIRIQQAIDPGKLICECCEFCRAVGAEHIFATGDSSLVNYEFHTSVLRMSCRKVMLPLTDVSPQPVTQQTMQQWIDIYNARMIDVPNASYMTLSDGKKICDDQIGYFVIREDVLLGIGVASGNEVRAVVSVVPGGGRDVLLSLCQVLDTDIVEVEVASENTKAMRLYEGLGFEKTAEISSWYKIL